MFWVFFSWNSTYLFETDFGLSYIGWGDCCDLKLIEGSYLFNLSKYCFDYYDKLATSV